MTAFTIGAPAKIVVVNASHRGMAVLVTTVLVASCAGGSEGAAPFDTTGEDATDRVADQVVDARGAALDDCSPEALNDGDEEFVFTSAYRIVEGGLAERCLGDDDPTITSAWESLAAIAPADQLTELSLFAGFQPDGDNAEETLAFVNALDADGDAFQMSVNVIEAATDPDELLLTLAHEFTHVFTSTDAQLDRTDEAIDRCLTYFNGEGCFRDDSLIVAWIEQFWDDELLDDLDPFGDPEDAADDADVRCAADDGFFGPYAATDPEEDFAESFSAFVFRLEPATAGQTARLDWIARQPGLIEFRERADRAGLTPLANEFDVCGN